MPEIIVPAATTASELAYERAVLDTRRRMALAALIAGAAALLAALIVALAVLWLILSTPKATGFDADGVRCYRAASEMTCIKTAEPAR
jgi:uncharacterized RDD family membrane protein YckC